MIDEYVEKWIVKANSVGNLSFYAVEVRYPDDFYLPSLKEAEESIGIAKGIRDFVLKQLDGGEL